MRAIFSIPLVCKRIAVQSRVRLIVVARNTEEFSASSCTATGTETRMPPSHTAVEFPEFRAYNCISKRASTGQETHRQLTDVNAKLTDVYDGVTCQFVTVD